MTSQPDPVETINPYAPPGSEVAAAAPFARGAHRVPSGWVYAYVAAQGLDLLLWVAVFAGWIDVHASVDGGEVAIRVAAALTGLAWLQRQWKRLPMRLQMVKSQGVTPGQAAWRNLIPFYNLYWMFAVNAALCDGINQMLARKDRPRTAPTALSLLCPLSVIVLRGALEFVKGPMTPVVLALGAFLWVMYMVRVEMSLAQAKRKARG